MKPILILVLTGLLLWLPSPLLRAQNRGAAEKTYEAAEKITREFKLTGNLGGSTLALYNTNGSVTVQGYNGPTVQVELIKTITANSAELLAQGQQEAQPGFEQHADSVLLYVAAPYDSRPNRNYQYGRFSDNWRDERPGYSWRFDYVVKVPAGMDVRVATVNGGKVLVQDVTGPLQARNVNGPVTIRGARQATLAHTVNGDVEVSYATAPPRASSYRTVNGNITVSYPPGASADLYFKSLHGELYTDFPQAEVLPARVTTNQQREGQGIKYKLSRETAVRLGKGGPDYRFETINGNATIKQQPR